MDRDEWLLTHAKEVGEFMSAGQYAECIQRMQWHIANESDPIVLGNCHSTIANCLCNLGDIVGARQSFTTAESYRIPETLDSPHGDLGEVRLLLAEGNIAKAQEILLRNLSSDDIHLEFFHDAHCEMLEQMGDSLAAMNKFEQALPYFEQAAECHKNSPGGDHRQLFLNDCLLSATRCLVELDRYDDAKTLVREMKGDCVGHQLADALYYLGMAQSRSGEIAASIKTLKEAESHALGFEGRYKMVLLAESEAYQAGGAKEIAEALLRRAEVEPEIQ